MIFLGIFFGVFLNSSHGYRQKGDAPHLTGKCKVPNNSVWLAWAMPLLF